VGPADGATASPPEAGRGKVVSQMDMRHDFRPDPEVREADLEPTTWLPEALAIAGIFAVLWCVLAFHVMVRGTPW
jgi:hypothetical protein